MRPYRFATPAYRDLSSILEYLSVRSSSAANRFLSQLDVHLCLLVRYPYMGFRREDFGHPHLRFITHAGYVIAYDPEANPLTILAIRHSSRNPSTLFEGLTS